MSGTHGLPVERCGREQRSRLIVIVEDNPVTLAGWTELLRDAGYDVVGASSFEEGRNALESGPRLLIVDVRLGAYNGLQLIMRAQSQTPELPTIVLTGFADAVVLHEAARLGALCLEKPVDPDRLLAAVASAIDCIGAEPRVAGGPRSEQQHRCTPLHANATGPDRLPDPLSLADGDVLMVRQPAGLTRSQGDVAAHSPTPQFGVSVRGDYEHGVRLFGSYDQAIAYGEQIAATRRARLFYVDTGVLILLKDTGANPR